ncbi:MAG: MscL family protein [Acidobacteria bacterium]|nr:MscL family protein [Acidobacteriota bacterium]
MLLGHVDFSNLFINLFGTHCTAIADAKKAGAVVIGYGAFVNTLLEFIIVASAVFLVVQPVNRLRRPTLVPVPAAPASKECPHGLSSIPLKATRCPHCTSELKTASENAATNEGVPIPRLGARKG